MTREEFKEKYPEFGVYYMTSLLKKDETRHVVNMHTGELRIYKGK